MTRSALITGVHRSGTSMVARSLQRLGVWLGADDELVAPAPDNPDGFFEHVGLVAASNALFEQLGGGWDCPPTLPFDWRGSHDLDGVRHLARTAISELSTRTPWGWKDPRAAAVLPFWIDLVPDAGVVLCLRNPLEVAASLRARNGISLALGLRLWAQHMEAATRDVPASERIVTHYDAWMQQPQAEVERLAAFLGLTPGADAPSKAASVPANHLRHTRFDGRALRMAHVAADLRELYASLCDEAGWPDHGASKHDAARTAPRPAAVNGVAPQRNAATDLSGRVSTAAVDLGIAEYQVYKRNGRVAQLERQVAELQARLARAGDPAGRVDAAAHDRLQSTLYDLHLAVGELNARVTNGMDRETADRDIAYVRMIRDVRSEVLEHVPPTADVLMISEGEPALLDLHGRIVRHFPVGPTPGEPGPRPADDRAATAHLAARQALGATHLIVPSSAAWWTVAYPALAQRLARTSTTIGRANEAVAIHLLHAPVERDREPTFDSALSAVRRRSAGAGAELSVLDWTTDGVDLPSELGLRPPDLSNELPYLDATIGVVVVDDRSEPRWSEAHRVASVGVVCRDAGEWLCSWTAAPAPVSADVIVVAAEVPNVSAYADALLATMPLGFTGRLTIIAPTACASAWQQAIGARGDVVESNDHGGLGRVGELARADGAECLVVVDGTALPLDGWLPALLAPLGRSWIGAAAARRRAHAGAPVTLSFTVEADDLRPDFVDDRDPLARTVELAAAGAFATQRTLLAKSQAFDGRYATLPFAVPVFCRELAAAGLDTLVLPEAEMVDLDLRSDAPGATADRQRFFADATKAAP